MRPIPQRIKDTLERMPRMRACELRGEGFGMCHGRIEWHHVFIYAGKQINELWAILGACHGHHTLVQSDRIVREAFERRSLEIATKDELAKYPARDWEKIIRFQRTQE